MSISIKCDVPFNPSDVIQRTRMTAPLAVLVAGQMVAACPSDANERTRQMCDAMSDRRGALAAVLNVRKRKPGGLRPYIAKLDNAWGSFDRRLEAAASVPDGGELASAAAHLRGTILPHGVSDLHADVATKHIESQRMLDVIREQNLSGEIDRIAGPGFLAAARAAHAALTDAAGLGAEAVQFGPRDVALALANLTSVIQLYVIRLAAEVDPGDAASVTRFNTAVAGLLRAREERPSSAPPDAQPASTNTTPTTTSAAPTNGATNGVAHS